MKKKVIFKGLVYFFIFIFVVVVLGLCAIVMYYGKDLPDYKSLKNYNPPVTTRLYSNDGKFLKEYAKEKRLFVPIEQIPDLVKNAFISAEDAAFYKHIGINPKAIISAFVDNAISKYYGVNKVRGGSTITQQVAKNFLLSNEKTFERKVKEAILSIRMNQSFSKDEILELYLNQIFLGNRSYGVASASLNYFNKSLDELTIDEAGLLASLPKAPAKLDPTKGISSDLLDRRNWVLSRMKDLNYINETEYEEAVKKPIILKEKNIEEVSDGEFFSEEVRKEIVRMYGEDQLLEGGNVVITTLNPKLQEIADKYLKLGIERYDMKHGFRGAIDNIYTKDFEKNWGDLINSYQLKDKIRNEWQKAVVLNIDDNEEQVLIGLEKINFDENFIDNIEGNDFVKVSDDDDLLITGYIPLKNMLWAKRYITVNEVGEDIKKVSDVGLKKGDIIVVERDKNNKNEFILKQIPSVNGALVAMNPHNGEILAMMGGYIDSQTDFNRATQAERQTGSILKTFAYISALENGYTPASIVIDEEIELNQGINRPPYKPKNNEEQFFGPTTLRVGLEKSRNVATVRLASDVGLNKVVEVIRRFGVNDKPRKIYSIVLGSAETNLIKVVRAYSMIVNGGKEIQPTLIEKIQNREGKTIFATNKEECRNCKITDKNVEIGELIIPNIIDNRKTIIDSATAYQITSMLEGVVQRGTAWRAKAIGKPIGAKTGTTNDSNDAWFVGFSPDLVVGVYIGFDRPATLGKNETGSSVSAPIFVNFMREALKDQPSIPFRVPPTVNLIRIDTKTGYYPTPDSNSKDIVLEAFKEGDKIIKFEEEISDEDIEGFMLEQEQNENTNRPIIIQNIEHKVPLINNHTNDVEEFDEDDYIEEEYITNENNGMEE